MKLETNITSTHLLRNIKSNNYYFPTVYSHFLHYFNTV